MIPELAFPDPRQAADHGLVALGGDYRPERLLAAYACGIFPWPCEDLPFAWFSPDPRLILRPQDILLSRSLRKRIRRGDLRVTFDQAFSDVVYGCATARRDDEGTWIIEELADGMSGLHRMGFAHSVEVWQEDLLVGGLYGVSLGNAFYGESMFHRVSDASKVALVGLAARLTDWGFRMIDCQVPTDHLKSLGAIEISRDAFLDELAEAVKQPTRRGSWSDHETVNLDSGSPSI